MPASPEPRLRLRTWRRLSDPLARTSAGLAASTVLSAALGFGFWALAARIYTPGEVGRDSALVAALLALSSIGQLNLNNVFPRFLPQVRPGSERRYISLGYAAAALVSLLAGLLFVIVAPMLSQRFGFIRHSLLIDVAFPLAVASWTIFCLQDAVLTALAKAVWLPVENGMFSLLRVMLLPLPLVVFFAHGILMAYVVPMFVTIPVMNWLIVRRALPETQARRAEMTGFAAGWRPLFSFLAKDFLGSAAAQLAMSAIPIIVLALLGAANNAYFYVPFTLVTTLDSLFLAVSASLTTEAARAPERAHELTQRTFRWLVRLQAPAAIALIVLAPFVLAPYGHAYVAHGVVLLRILAATSCLRAIVFLYGATARLQGHGARLLLQQVFVATSIITCILVGGHLDGVNGVGYGWLVAWSVGAAAVAVPLYRFRRSASVWGAPERTEVAAMASLGETATALHG